MSIATGTKLGQYEVQDFIGQGAMGLVYRAYHAQLERTGAIKVMQAISPDADGVARFRHEAQAIAKMRHPNIVDVYDFGEFEGTPYMIVEFVPGGSLAQRMAHGALDHATALKYLRGIAAGLDYAHAHGVVHRDVKPANVLLTAEDTPVLADFGLAKLLQGSSLKSMTGVTTGTPAYMAPEQVTGGRVGPASDRYSLATIAYEMLTGVIPFDGEALMELLYAQVHREPVPPSSRYKDLGPRVDEVIMRGLAKDPVARWDSCTAFVDALAAALATPATARAAAKTVVMGAPVASTAPIAKPVASPRPRPEATVAMPFPPPVGQVAAAPAVARPRRHTRRNVAIGVAAVLLLLLVFGTCQALGAATLALSPSIATPGSSVQVTAKNVPAYQPGTIQMHSFLRTFPFRADGSGRVDTYIAVPHDTPLGDHTVNICWNNACHASATLRVVAGAGVVLPTPVDSSPGATPGTTRSPTPGSTPHPTSYPSPTPTKPPPSPSTNPCPTPPGPAKATAAPATVLLNNPVTITGSNFNPNEPVNVNYYLNGAYKRTIPTRSDCSGAFSVSFIPASSTTDIGTGQVKSVDAFGRSATSNTFTVAL